MITETDAVILKEAAPCANQNCGHYLLDEAGDGTLFDRRGRVLIGQEGCSQFYMLGLLEIDDPAILTLEMDDLRARLLADSYFRGIPSFQPQQRKTALFFHAKDDVPEVRREVFALLMRHKVRFFAVVRDKWETLRYVRERSVTESGFRYNHNDAYNSLVQCLFTGRLHRQPSYEICFARRGKSDRTKALHDALRDKRAWYFDHFGMTPSDSQMSVTAAYPWNVAGLQGVDYFLWALQRFYEKKEDRYLEYVWDKCALINDRDLAGPYNSGTYFGRTKRKGTLTLASLRQARGI